MYADYDKFEEALGMTSEVFATWEENMKDFTNVAREGTVPHSDCETSTIPAFGLAV